MRVQIFPARLAESLKDHAGEKYRPSNGTEGEVFFGQWCCRCQKDKSMREGCNVDECDDNERCDIIADTMQFNINDDEYPSEWMYGEDGQPCCTAFVASGDERSVFRDPLTIDMFGDVA
jgi:hypothetical protein